MLGVVSERDLHQLVHAALPEADKARLRIRHLLRHEPYVVEMNAPLDEVADEMAKQHVGSAVGGPPRQAGRDLLDGGRLPPARRVPARPLPRRSGGRLKQPDGDALPFRTKAIYALGDHTVNLGLSAHAVPVSGVPDRHRAAAARARRPRAAGRARDRRLRRPGDGAALGRDALARGAAPAVLPDRRDPARRELRAALDHDRREQPGREVRLLRGDLHRLRALDDGAVGAVPRADPGDGDELPGAHLA